MGSPWPGALGPAIDEVRVELRPYLDPIPDGAVGEGEGVFTTLGTRRRWVRPLLRLAGGGSLFPVWARDVPFEVRNSPVPGRAAVRAERRVRVDGQVLVMRDEIARTPAGVVERLGLPTRLEAAFRVEVDDGALHLVSRKVRLRFRRLVLPLGPIAPVIDLVERFDPDDGRQHVALHVRAPGIGRLYEYEGSFTWRIRAAS